MDDVTDTVFRQVIMDCAAPDLLFTEFVNVDGLQSPGRDKVAVKLGHAVREKPLIAQIWGLNPENFKTTAEQIVKGEFGLFQGIDLNMGCPIKDIVKNGACSGLINNRDLAEDIIQATKAGANGKLPISVKTRLGYNEIDPTWYEFLLKQGLDMLTIHGRTKSQMSKVPANWPAIGNVVKLRDKLSPKTLIVGNGDVKDFRHGVQLAKTYKVDGIMIGRAIFDDPYVFKSQSPWKDMAAIDKLELFKKHVRLFAKTWGRKRHTRVLNKFCKVYVNNFDGAKELREQLMAASNTNELLKLINQAEAKQVLQGEPA